MNECTCLQCPIHKGQLYTRTGENYVYEAVVDGRLDVDLQGCVWRRTKNGLVRTEIRSHRGNSLIVRARIDGRFKKTMAHRLVYYHHFGPIPPGMLVIHIDGDGSNNNPDNLKLASSKESAVKGGGKVDHVDGSAG